MKTEKYIKATCRVVSLGCFGEVYSMIFFCSGSFRHAFFILVISLSALLNRPKTD